MMSNFLKRTLSGFFFVALVVGSILLDKFAFLSVFIVITGWTVLEFHKLTNNLKDVTLNSWIGVVGAALLFATSFLHASGIIRYPIFSVYGLYIVLVLLAELYMRKPNPIHNWAYFILGQVFIALPFSLLNFIAFIDVKDWLETSYMGTFSMLIFNADAVYKPLILLAVFVTIWVNDTGAYIFGITLGKHRLFERISPKKSWEGFFGGAIAALASGYVFSLLIPEISLLGWLIFSEIIVIFGTFGDLMESLMKRTVHVKDSGNALPGHGGLLDRFDSLLLAAPMIFIYLSFFV